MHPLTNAPNSLLLRVSSAELCCNSAPVPKKGSCSYHWQHRAVTTQIGAHWNRLASAVALYRNFNHYLVLACHQRHLVAHRGFVRCFVVNGAAFAKVLVKDESVSVLK